MATVSAIVLPIAPSWPLLSAVHHMYVRARACYLLELLNDVCVLVAESALEVAQLGRHGGGRLAIQISETAQ